MREILPNQLWIGNAGDGRDAERLLQVGVVAVINLAAEKPSPTGRCGAGTTRSPAAALAIVQGGSPEENLKEIVAGHPHDVSPHLWEAVQRVCRETVIKRAAP